MNIIIAGGLAVLGSVLLIAAFYTVRLLRRSDRRLLAIEQQCLDLVQASGETHQRLRWLDDANADLLQHVNRLAADVIHRELYRDKGNRQTLVMDAVGAGASIESLVAEHGLSTDEAELLLSLQIDRTRGSTAMASL